MAAAKLPSSAAAKLKSSAAAKLQSSPAASRVNLSGATYCIVTGASQGIGRAIAVEISRQLGPKSLMLLIARNQDELDNTAKGCKSENVDVETKVLDLATANYKRLHKTIVDSLASRELKADDFDTSIIIHNVGSLGNLAVDTARMQDVEEMREYYDLNVFNVIALNTQFLRVFKTMEEKLVIVNITSLCAIKPMSGMAYYCSGKAAREMYFRVLAEEKKHIRVLNYSPGPVQTAMVNYVLHEAINKNLKEVFQSFVAQRTLLKPEVTAQKCVKVLLLSKFTPGEHVDYFDEEKEKKKEDLKKEAGGNDSEVPTGTLAQDLKKETGGNDSEVPKGTLAQ